MNKEKTSNGLQQNPLPEEGMGRREFIKKCLVGSAAVAAVASTPFVGRLEAVEASESIVSFDVPDIVSTLPDDVVVHQNFMVKFAENGQVLCGIEISTNGVWQEHYPSVSLGSVCGGLVATNMVYTDPGDIASPGTYRFILKYVPDGGGAEEAFEAPSFEIVDPNPVVEPEPVDIPSFDSTTGILDLPSVEIGNETYTVELQWDEGIQGFKIISYALIN